MKALVTGAAGFIGSKLVPILEKRGHQIAAYNDDIRDYNRLKEFVSRSGYDVAIHLAGISFPPACDKDPKVAYDVNTTGTLLLMEALRDQPRPVRIIFPSTAQVYGPPQMDSSGKALPIREEHLAEPRNVYGRTKLAAELLLKDREIRGKNTASVMRIFNHTHKSQPPDFFLPHAYHLLAGARAGSTVEIPVGNVELYRDLGSVGDLLQAFVLVCEGEPTATGYEVYNVCSGTAKHLKTVLEKLADRMKFKIQLRIDPSLLRKSDLPWVCGSYEKIQQRYSWTPHCDTEDRLIDAFLADL